MYAITVRKNGMTEKGNERKRTMTGDLTSNNRKTKKKTICVE